ncbi:MULTISPECIES: hypothetical protein [unclassified Lacinutrix]
MNKLIALILILSSFSCNAQEKCIDNENIGLGGDFNSIDYTFRCPTYNFSFTGDKSKEWNILNNPIDINQIADKVLPIKTRLENKIKEYAGEKLFSKLEFYSVQISYPDSIQKFKTRGPSVDMEKCNAKYFFDYYFIPTDSIKYCVGIALDENENIVSEFNFPSKSDYKIIDDNLDLCEVIEIAKETNNEIEPIDKVSFEFDPKNKVFYWSITQKIIDMKEGENEYNAIAIDAADKTKVISFKRKTFIQY